MLPQATHLGTVDLFHDAGATHPHAVLPFLPGPPPRVYHRHDALGTLRRPLVGHDAVGPVLVQAVGPAVAQRGVGGAQAVGVTHRLHHALANVVLQVR